MQRQTLFPPLIVRTAPSPTSTPRLPLLTGRATEEPLLLGGVSNAPRFINEGWTIALTVLTSVRLLLLLTLWIYLTKRTLAVQVPLRRVWLTQLLLASLALSHVILYAFVVQPTPASCAILRLGVGLSYALPFVVLTLKLIIVTATYKGYSIPRFCQILLLVSMTGIQLALSIQWWLLVPTRSTAGGTCGPSIFDWLCHLTYINVLLLSGTLLAMANHHIKANRRETMFLGLCFGLNIPVWMVWSTVAGLLHDRPGMEDKCLAFGLWTATSLVLFVMFLPKSRQQIAIGESGLYTEDGPVVKPISELTVHKLYYPVYPERRSNSIECGTAGRSGIVDDGGSDILSREELPSIPRLNAHWYPPIRETRSGPDFRTASYANRMSRPYHHPRSGAATSPSSVRFDDDSLASNVRRLHVAGSGRGRCLTPPSEEGSTTPSVQESERLSVNEDSDLDMTNFRERNVDGVSYTQVSRQMPMY